jgi:hypothetical protein
MIHIILPNCFHFSHKSKKKTAFGSLIFVMNAMGLYVSEDLGLETHIRKKNLMKDRKINQKV